MNLEFFSDCKLTTVIRRATIYLFLRNGSGQGRPNSLVTLRHRGENMMRTKAVTQFAAAMCMALLATASLPAATTVPISDLYNTGMSTPWDAAIQTPLPGSDPGSVVDPHWDVAYDAPGATPVGPYIDTQTIDDSAAAFVGNQFNRYQLDLDDDPARQDTELDESQWIKPDVPNPNGPGGVYLFTTTFTTNQALTTISISGFFKGTDILAIQLNGGPLIDPGSPHGAPSEHTPSTPSRPFTITGAGTFTNTLTFYYNRPGPAVVGLRVQFSSATFTVPEPSTIALSVLGLVGFGAVRLRRRWNSQAK